jgi:hypothetical protein
MSRNLTLPHDPQVKAALDGRANLFLVAFYNASAEKIGGIEPVKKFSSKEKAISEIVAMLGKTNYDVDLVKLTKNDVKCLVDPNNPEDNMPEITNAPETPAGVNQEVPPATPVLGRTAAAPRAPKAATSNSGGGAARALVPRDGIIKILIEGNPKRGKSAERFALYQNGMTVADFIKAGGTSGDVNWDIGKNLISVTPAQGAAPAEAPVAPTDAPVGDGAHQHTVGDGAHQHTVGDASHQHLAETTDEDPVAETTEKTPVVETVAGAEA